jgi:hypothetical protein
MFVLLMGCFITSKAQDSLFVKQTIFGGVKQIHTKHYTPSNKNLKKMMLKYPEAHKTFKRARTNNAFSHILGAAGGALLGWPLGIYFAGGDPNWFLLVPSAGLIGASIPLSINYNKKMKKAVQQYNYNLNF